jgi:hypothetical protein
MKTQSKVPGKVNTKNAIIASEKDQALVFNALINPKGPNQKLLDADERYKLFIEANK